MRRNKKYEAGSAMVESALILMIFVSTLLAVVDFGQFLFFHQVLTERVRNAARMGALNWTRGCHEDCVKNLVVYDRPSGETYNGIAVPRLTRQSVTVTPPDASFDSRVTVTVSNYSYAVFNPWLTTTNGGKRIRPITASAPIESPNAN
ncbi:MAG TPA: TadE family protein [Bryobacteraceae bacterium]|nr:TadE family protein [Bryobacteraceae bacterium]